MDLNYTNPLLEEILYKFPDEDLITLDGYDTAIIGYITYPEVVIVYSATKIIDELIKSGLSRYEALEFYDYNIEGAYLGPKTPILVHLPRTYSVNELSN